MDNLGFYWEDVFFKVIIFAVLIAIWGYLDNERRNKK